MGKMLRWTLRKAKTAESFVLLFWKEDSVEFRREQDRPAVGQKKPVGSWNDTPAAVMRADSISNM